MRAVRHKDTKPELLVRLALHAHGFRYRLHVKALPGKPDIVLPKYHVAIFVHGCFWHGHHCHLFKIPKTRTKFWVEKIEGNCKRDIISAENLMAAGWRTGVVWECALKGKSRLPVESLVDRLAVWIVDPLATNIELTGRNIERVPDT